jgi:hypothetical protein
VYLNIYGYAQYYLLSLTSPDWLSNYILSDVSRTAYATNNATGGKKMCSGLSTGG